MKSPLSDQNATNRAYKGLKEMIFKYELVPGQKITYDQLAAKLKLSKTPIINALYRLEQEGFVTSSPNRGFFIKEIELDELENLFKIREVLEMLAIEEFMKNANAEGLKEVELAFIAHRDYRFEEYVTRKRHVLDSIFHSKIAEHGGNMHLAKLLKQIWEQIYLRHRIEGFFLKRFEETPIEHQAIFDALREGNLENAQKAIRNHIQKGREAAILAIQRHEESYRFSEMMAETLTNQEKESRVSDSQEHP
jgi:DNA-binding GntR family transcriptional regulator